MALLDLSIVIVNYNTFELSCQCIRSIHDETTLINYEIILVDNKSSECSPKDFLKFFPDLLLIENQINWGFGIANNMGMKKAKGRYILLLNSDTIVVQNAIERSVIFFDNLEDPYIGVLGCKLVCEDGSPQLSHFGKKHGAAKWALNTNIIFQKFSSYRNKRTTRFDHIKSREVGGVSGAFMLLKYCIYEETGGFDPDFFMYCEETEWMRNRIAPLGYKCYYFTEVNIIHLVGGSDFFNKMYKQNVLSFYLYWYKLGYLQYIIYLIGNGLNLFCILLILPFSRNKAHMIRTLKIHFSLIFYALFIIPRYSNNTGSRPTPLKLKELGTFE